MAERFAVLGRSRIRGSSIEPIAVRGDRLALHDCNLNVDDDPDDHLSIVRLGDSGLIEKCTVFAPDDMGAALVELDELWLAELEPRDVETYRAALAWAEAYGSGDEARLKGLMHHDFVLTDHRVMGFGQLDREEMLELMRSRIGTRGLAVPVTSAVHLLREGMVIGTYHDRSSGNDGAEYVTDTVILCCVQDHRISEAAFFDADRVDAALQAAVALVRPVQHAVDRLDLSGDVVARDIEVELPTGEVIRGLDQLAGRAGEIWTGEREVLAVRLDRVALVAVYDQPGGPVSRLMVEEVDRRGRLGRVRVFAGDALVDVVNHFDERWLDLDEAATDNDRLSIEWSKAQRTRDVAGIAPLLHDDFSMVDHRPLGYPPQDADALLETIAAPAPSQAVMLDDGDPLARSEHGSVRCAVILRYDHGRIAEAVATTSVTVYADRRLLRIELFPDDEPERALARFEELTRADVAVVVPAGPDWRSLLGTPITDRSSHPNTVRELFELGAELRPGDPIAVRSERFLVHGIDIRYGDDIVEYLALVVLDSACGMIERTVLFDPDQLDAALGELDRVWLDTLDPADAETYRVVNALREACTWLEAERVTELCHPDFVYVSHRGPLVGELDRDGFFELLETRRTTRALGLAWSVSVDRLGGGVIVMTGDESTANDGSSEFSDPSVFVARVLDGQVSRLEQFTVGRLGDALARARELTDAGAGGARPIVGNAASEALERELGEDGSLLRIDRLGDAPRLIDVVAAFDDRCCLGRVEGTEGAALVVAVVGEDGVIVDSATFDTDDEADARRDATGRWFAFLSERRQKVGRMAVAFGTSWVAPSTTPFGELISEEFVLIDGRTLGMGVLDRSGFEQALRGREVDGSRIPPVPSRVQFVSDDVFVFRAANTGVAPDSGVEWEEIACNVLVADGPRIIRLEMFDENGWDASMARAREVAAGHLGTPPGERGQPLGGAQYGRERASTRRPAHRGLRTRGSSAIGRRTHDER